MSDIQRGYELAKEIYARYGVDVDEDIACCDRIPISVHCWQTDDGKGLEGSGVAMSGVPGGGFIGELIICSLFFPQNMAEAYPILVVIGTIIDPPATMINASGDYVVSFIVERFVDGKDWLQKNNIKA